MRYSVLVPLEFHRGIAPRCIRRWVEEQEYPRGEYEVVVAADEAHPAAQIGEIEAILSPHDRMLRCRGAHDIALVTAAARVARGAVLLFTESHCLPEPGCLAACDEVLDGHPEWGGFSGLSFPLTHNLLSEIEAELYERDIAHNLRVHPWLKVLDQIFVIRRDAYEASGGLEPQYGHFAEWLFAARAFRRQVEIGHAPQVLIGHHYVGDLADLEEFTRDFAAGEMRFAAGAASDPCGDDFPPPPEWQTRGQWDDRLLDCLSEMRWRSDHGEFADRLPFSSGAGADESIPWTSAIRRRLGLRFESGQAMVLAAIAVRSVELLLRSALLTRRRRVAKALFETWVKAVVHHERLRFQFAHGRSGGAATAEAWSPVAAPAWASLGIHELEFLDGTPFRWSAPAACVDLALEPGRWLLRIDVLPILGEPARRAVRFHFAGRLVSGAEMVQRADGFDLEIESPGSERAILGWTAPAFPAPGDNRRLGLPLTRVAWRRADHVSAEGLGPSSAEPRWTAASPA